MGAWKDMLIDADNALADQQAAEDWYRYEMERDDAIARRRELIMRARKLQTTGLKLRRFFPDLGEFNLALAAEFRAEAREIRRDWR
jgi:hypothetical protein